MRAGRKRGRNRRRGGRAQGRGLPQRGRLGRRHSGTRPARRHLCQARSQARDPLHVGRPRIDPGADRGRRRHRDGHRASRRLSAPSPRARRSASSAARSSAHPDLYWFVPAASPVKTIEDFNGKTVAFSLTGSSSHAGLLALIAQYHLNVRPTSPGPGIAATITQTMTGQVDVGFGAVAPMRSTMAADGRIRIIASGNDRGGAAHPQRPGQPHQPGDARRPQGRAQALHRAYKETVDGCIPIRRRSRSTPIRQNAGERDRARCASSFRRTAWRPTKWSAVDQIMAEAIQNKFLAAPLTKDQLTDLIRALRAAVVSSPLPLVGGVGGGVVVGWMALAR